MDSQTIDTQAMLPVGKTLQMGKYRIDRHLASGGFGNTYVITNLQFDEQFALKEFFMQGISERGNDNTTVSVSNRTNISQFEGQREKFKKEARRLRKLHNSHVVGVHDLFEENGTAYYVMDLIDGMSLSERLKLTHTPLSEQEAIGIFMQVLDALEEVHQLGIWHLDIKPGNIMLDMQGNATLIDFGASKQLTANGSHTMSTSFSFTPSYAPAEQIDQNMNLIGPWTDLYALGATLYNLLTNAQPPSLTSIMAGHGFAFPATTSKKTRQLIKWLMMPNPSRRPQSVAEVREFMKKPHASEPIHKSVTSDEADRTVFAQYQPVKNEEQPKETDAPITESDEYGSESSKPYLKLAIAASLVIGLLVGSFFYINSGSEVDDTDNEKVEQIIFESSIGTYTYTGEVNKEGIPDGFGEATFKDGRYYRGPFVNGIMEGDGAYFRYGNGDTFEGSFENNSFKEGRYTDKQEGVYFVGTFKDGKPDQGTEHELSEKYVLTDSEKKIVSEIKRNMVMIEGGTFQMGATEEQESRADKAEFPVHTVTLSSFSIGKYEVTQKEWEMVMKGNPSKNVNPQYPIVNISWDDCQKFITKLNEMTGEHYRLPTEAEWEYAARGGTNSKKSIYAGANAISDIAWYKVNSKNLIHPVGKKKPNEAGLFDMSGNAWEWCADKYATYSSSSQVNPVNKSGSKYVLRGGGCSSDMKVPCIV